MNNDIEESYCSFDVSKQLKEKGFKARTHSTYITKEAAHCINGAKGGEEEYFFWYTLNAFINNNIKKIDGFIMRPTYSQAFKFFRDTYGLLVSPFQSMCDKTDDVKGFYFEIGKIGELTTDFATDVFPTYEEAELDCIRQLIKIAKEA